MGKPDNKRLCLAIPSLNAGGMERVMSELANFFSSKQDLEIHLIMYGKRPRRFYKLLDQVVVHCPKSFFNDSFRTFSTLLRLIYLRRQIQKLKPVTVLSFGEYWNNLVLLSLLGMDTPVFVSDRCRPDKSLGRLHNALRKILYSKASGIIVQTKTAKEIYQRIVAEDKIRVIGNPVRELSADGYSKRINSILMVSRLIATKHHDRLISIFSKLQAPDWRLVLVGNDAQKQKHLQNLQQLSEQFDVSTRVEFAGEKKDVESYYMNSSVFAFTSSSEGFPNVVGEALSAGLPVVSYDCVAGPSEMISDGENGFLVPVFDDELFRQRLQTLIDNEALRVEMGKKAIESIKKFSVETIGQEYLNFILP